jgi:hypothetical protein
MMFKDSTQEDIIDPDLNLEALNEAMGIPVQEETMVLELLNHKKIKVRYLPQSIAASLEYDDGQPMTPPGSKLARKPKFDYRKWARERLPKMNDLALKNIRIVDDTSGQEPQKGSHDVRLSLISSGEFFRLEGLCFPGASEDLPDSEVKDVVPHRKGGKGLRSGKSDTSSE